MPKKAGSSEKKQLEKKIGGGKGTQKADDSAADKQTKVRLISTGMIII
jgi:hypothetical protein